MTTRQTRNWPLLATAIALLLAFPALAAKPGKTPNPNNGHGKVTAVSATSITVTPKNDPAKTFTITPDTKISLDGKTIQAADDAGLLGRHAQINSKDGITAKKITVKPHTKKGNGGKKEPIAPTTTL